MAEVFRIPEIKGLEGLLALVTNPRDFASYLAKLQAMIDAINERMGDLENKKQADAYLSRAQETARLATVAMEDAKRHLGTAKEESEKIVADAKAIAASTDEDRQSMAAAKALFETTNNAERAAIATATKDVAARESAVSKREADAKKREDAVAAEEKRLQALVSTLRSQIGA